MGLQIFKNVLLGGENITDVITLAADVANGWNGITSDMLLGVLDEIKSVLPIVVPAVVGFLGLRKAWGLIKSAIKGA